MSRRLYPAVVLLIVALLASTAFGRLIPDWPYKRLFKEADLVVIATVDGSVDTTDRLKTAWKVDLLGMNTTFTIQSTLKGKARNARITVLHYRTPEGRLLEDGPTLVTIRTKRPPTKGVQKARFRAEYLLFLKARADGRFEPVSGQIDPALSVRELSLPDSFFVDTGRQ